MWQHESGDFTPWLAANIDVLSDAIGLPLTVVGQEVLVGDFRLDIHATDPDGNTVIIENQLEPSDHFHLGQLLVYASGLEATTGIWITTRLRDEHRSALTWLNERTDSDVRAFGIASLMFVRYQLNCRFMHSIKRSLLRGTRDRIRLTLIDRTGKIPVCAESDGAACVGVSPAPATRAELGMSDAGSVEAFDEAGFARMCLPQRGDARGECVVAIFASGERLEIGEQCDGGVVVGRFAGGDQCVDA